MRLRTFLKPLSFLPAIFLMYLIFSFSAQEADVSSQVSYKVSVFIVKTADDLLELGLDEYQVPYYAERIHTATRKLAHMTEYFLLAIAVSFPLYVYGMHGILLTLVAGLFCIGFACGDEYHQSFVAGRAAQQKDVIIDGIGILIGIILVRMIGWTGRKTIFRPLPEDVEEKERKREEKREAKREAKLERERRREERRGGRGRGEEPEGRQPYGAQGQQPYGGQGHQPYGGQGQYPYGAQGHQPYGAQGQYPYGAQGRQPYGGQSPYGTQGQSGGPYGGQSPYGTPAQPGGPYGGQSPYGTQAQPGGPYGGQPAREHGRGPVYEEPQEPDYTGLDDESSDELSEDMPFARFFTKRKKK